MVPINEAERGIEAESGSPPPGLPDLVPARMLNEFAYCPRLAYLEWVQGDWADSSDTVEGRFHHRNVEAETGALPAAGEAGDECIHARSVLLSGAITGLIARIDLIEGEGRLVTPVDYKRGAAPDCPDGVWEPERVQLCAQGMVLEENGFECSSGVIYFVKSRQRVPVAFDAALRARTLELLADMRVMGRAPLPPSPLVDSPKCPRCSLVGICLPDEVNVLRAGALDEPRRLLPARDDALPLYVQSAGARVGKHGDELVIQDRDGDKQSVRIGNTSQVSLFGRVQISTQAVQELCDRGIPVCYLSSGGWFYGITRGMDHKNVALRRLQYQIADDEKRSTVIAQRLVGVKIRNCRTLLRRNCDGLDPRVLERLRELAEQAGRADEIASLLGVEGTAARLYFEHLGSALRAGDEAAEFSFESRNRRPPRDPVNALLSLAYSCLTRDFVVTLTAVGFDPYLGFYHQPRYGRPALALDLMEEFRPLVADSVVLSAINTGVVKAGDFVRRGGAVALSRAGRGKFLRAYERRMDELVTHPVFGYRISYRRVLEVQCRLFARYLGGEIPEYPAFATR